VASTASRREERRQLHQDLSRTQLLDAAEEVFGAKGFHDTTLKAIAELAEFSVGSVYSFFENKDDLFLNVFLRRGEEFLPGMEEAATAGDDPVAQLHALVDFEVGFFRRHPHFGRLYLRSVPGELLATSRQLADNFDRAMEVHAGIFRRGQAAGVLRDGDPEVLARLLSGLVAAFQATDPAVVGEPMAAERLPLTALHDVVAGAFGR
jgi:AcrR family transcriptional regulator